MILDCCVYLVDFWVVYDYKVYVLGNIIVEYIIMIRGKLGVLLGNISGWLIMNLKGVVVIRMFWDDVFEMNF